MSNARDKSKQILPINYTYDFDKVNDTYIEIYNILANINKPTGV